MKEGYAIRRAESADCGAVFRIRNDKSVRAMSGGTDALSRSRHDTWFTAMLADSHRETWVLHPTRDARQVLGYARLDALPGCACVISIALCAPVRGQGLATPFIQAALDATELPVRMVTAQIRPENAASLRAFGRAGFVATHKDHSGMWQYQRVLARPRTVIDQIEAVRARNNTTWMDVLRLAWEHAPDETAQLLKSIHAADSEISALVAKLTEGRP